MAFITYLALSLFFVLVQSRCYTSEGDPWIYNPDSPVEAWMPCNTTADVTSCCSPRDYCMSNGLCMDAVVDNVVSQQGCTSSSWDEPCVNYCEGTDSESFQLKAATCSRLTSFLVSGGGLHFLWRCSGQTHCCASNATTSCCSDASAKFVTVEVGLSFHFPPSTDTSTATASTSTTDTASGTSLPATSTSQDASSATDQSSTTSTRGGIEAATASANGSSDSSSNDNRSMAIGLGLGVPFGVALIAAILYLASQMQKKRQQAAEKTHPLPRNVNDGYYGPTPPIGLHQGQYYQDAYVPNHHNQMDPSYGVGRGDPYTELDSTKPEAELECVKQNIELDTARYR